MGLSSPIQWCDGTVNPVMGCDGCELWQSTAKPNARRSCYAGLDHERKGGKTKGFAPSFDEVTRFPGRMAIAAAASDLRGAVRPDKPWLSGMPRLWFVSDMGDALSSDVPFEYLAAEICEVARSEQGSRHVWLWLTKQPKRMAEFSAYIGRDKWPTNLWPGTSITEPRYVDRIPQLLAVGNETTTRFLSVEPQHAPVSLADKLDGIGWVIQGGESGPRSQGGLSLIQFHQRRARPFNLAWARQVRDECEAAGVAYFLKQLGTVPVEAGDPVGLKDRHGGEWDEWPADLRVRRVPRGPLAALATAQGDTRHHAQRHHPDVGTQTSMWRNELAADMIEVVPFRTLVSKKPPAKAVLQALSEGDLLAEQEQALAGDDVRADQDPVEPTPPSAEFSNAAADDATSDRLIEHRSRSGGSDDLEVIKADLTVAPASSEVVDRPVLLSDGNAELPPSAHHANVSLVEKVALEIKEIVGETMTRTMEEVGNLLLRVFYKNSPELYRSNSRKKHASLARLLDMCDSMQLPLKRTFLANSLQMAAFMTALPDGGAYFRRLPGSHRVEVMRLRDGGAAETLAQRAVQKNYTVRKLRELVAKEIAKAKSTRERKPVPPILRSLTRISKELRNEETGRLALLKEEAEAFSDEQKSELLKLAKDLAKRAEQLQKLLA